MYFLNVFHRILTYPCHFPIFLGDPGQARKRRQGDQRRLDASAALDAARSALEAKEVAFRETAARALADLDARDAALAEREAAAGALSAALQEDAVARVSKFHRPKFQREI